MAQDYNEYLAVNVLNEQQVVSYRSLSRALKVHVNLAKQMLCEFHRKQNSKKPGSVHATYLLTGIRVPSPSQATVSQSQDGQEDEAPTPFRSVLLVKEEHLDQAKATFDKITGIHVYSLQSTGLSDIHSLTECNRKIAADYAAEDPLQAWKQYGTIQNSHVKRRTQKRPPPNTTALPKDPAAKSKPDPPTTKPASKASTDSQPASAKDTPEPEEAAPAPSKSAKTSKPAATKRQTSDIFKSFAKGANKSSKPSLQTAAEPSPAPAAPTEDESMGGMSDDDPADAAEDEVVETKEASGKSKKDRKAELEAMMDVEDELMEDAAAGEENLVDAPAGDREEAKEEEPKETLTVENGRRRGRRRVVKKKTVKDDEGYLVTREEAAWESFSEEEPVPKKAKVAPPPPTTAKGKKGAAKPGQGNIMSFFGKK